MHPEKLTAIDRLQLWWDRVAVKCAGFRRRYLFAWPKEYSAIEDGRDHALRLWDAALKAAEEADSNNNL